MRTNFSSQIALVSAIERIIKAKRERANRKGKRGKREQAHRVQPNLPHLHGETLTIKCVQHYHVLWRHPETKVLHDPNE